MKRAAHSLLRLLALLSALAVLLLIFEKNLIYFPTSDQEVTPAALGLPHEEMEAGAEDGVRVHGYFLPHQDSRLTVLLSHGNAGNISHRLDRAMLLQRRVPVDVLL